ncbi:PREDICTED: uncharacterized protein LOC104594573 isoform X1 [Nelumbo nucifera]|uniref:Uncharacterized protein LOC104594573 isoform X1 n=1 Tax=Nelumbo nucifera TaxID=4432 RepID=A0A1U8Q4Z7_NELNU|nr:PREDICTED: uncharacterized protein LOC104594573 isoform X1 [Nelumbo nucifera]
MGNNTSCVLSSATGGAVKVLFCDGRMEIYTRPIKAGQLMQENPCQFVCDSTDLNVGHRVPGLATDVELEQGQFYFLLPMDMLYSVLTDEEMETLSYRASRATKRGSSNNIGKIFPAFSDFCLTPSEFKTMESPDEERPQPTERCSKQRMWKPSLDTIVETPCML